MVDWWRELKECWIPFFNELRFFLGGGVWDKDFWEKVSNRHLEIWSPAVDLEAICIEVNIERMETPSEVQWQAEPLELPSLKLPSRYLPSSGCLTLIPVHGFLTSPLISDCGPWSLDQNHLERIVVVLMLAPCLWEKRYLLPDSIAWPGLGFGPVVSEWLHSCPQVRVFLLKRRRGVWTGGGRNTRLPVWYSLQPEGHQSL